MGRPLRSWKLRATGRVGKGLSFAVFAWADPHVDRPKFLVGLRSGGDGAVNDMFGAADITGLGRKQEQDQL